MNDNAKPSPHFVELPTKAGPLLIRADSVLVIGSGPEIGTTLIGMENHPPLVVQGLSMEQVARHFGITLNSAKQGPRLVQN